MEGGLAQQSAQSWSFQPQKASSPWSFSPQILLTFDDQFLLTAAKDGCLFTWKVFDKDGRGIKREREVGFAEEVLVTKTDMEEKVRIGSNEEGHGNYLPDSWANVKALCSLAAPRPAFSAHSLPTLPCCPLHCSLICFHRTLTGIQPHDCLMLCFTHKLAFLFLLFEGGNHDIQFSRMTSSS